MTVSVKISVNGNYKVPYTYKQGENTQSGVVSGYGMDRPNELTIPFSHGPDAMSLEVGPESPDNGEQPETAGA